MQSTQIRQAAPLAQHTSEAPVPDSSVRFLLLCKNIPTHTEADM